MTVSAWGPCATASHPPQGSIRAVYGAEALAAEPVISPEHELLDPATATQLKHKAAAALDPADLSHHVEIEELHPQQWSALKNEIIDITRLAFGVSEKTARYSYLDYQEMTAGSWILLMKYEGKIIGYALSHALEDGYLGVWKDDNYGKQNTAYLSWRAVLPAFQGHGLGRKMREAALESAKRRGFKYVTSHRREGIAAKEGDEVLEKVSRWRANLTYEYSRTSVEPRAAASDRAQPESKQGTHIRSQELLGEIVDEIKRLADSVTLVVGTAFGLPPKLIEKVRKRIQIRVYASSAQSYAEKGVLHISLSADVDSPKAMWRLLKTLASEVGHAFHQVLIESGPGRKRYMAEGVMEIFDAAAKLAFTFNLDFHEGWSTMKELFASLGEQILDALVILKKTPEQFKGGKSNMSQKVLAQIAAELIAKNYSNRYVFWALSMIASDFFVVLPHESRPLSYGAHHRISGKIVYQLMWSAPPLALPAIGNTLIAKNVDFKSVAGFRKRLNALLKSVSHPAERKKDIEPALKNLKEAIESIASKPLRLPTTLNLARDASKWQAKQALIEALIKKSLENYLPEYADRIMAKSGTTRAKDTQAGTKRVRGAV